MKVLKDSGSAENTWVIFTSDHGEMLGAHGLFHKSAFPYEDVYRVPYIVSGPSVANPRRTSSARISHTDLAPTILEISGVKPIDGTDGKSFVPILLNDPDYNADPHWSESYAEFFGSRFAYTQRIVWHDKYKYIFNGFDSDELYDLENDPDEIRNLTADPAHRTKLNEMAGRMWIMARKLNDYNIIESGYPTCRTAPAGPLVS